MSDDGTIYDWLAMQQQVLPEWIGGAGKNAGYGAPDIGSQATQLNYVQDLMGTGADPLMLWLAGQMQAGDLASTFEEDQVIPGVTEGRNFLENVLNTAAPDSIESLIAEHILAGGSPIEAVRLAEQSGLIKPSMRDTYAQGQKVGQEPDTSERDYYLKWATDAQMRLMNDKPEQRTPGKEILHPFVQKMLDAGFTDPRQTYSADYINPGLAGMDEKVAGQKAPLDAALKSRDAMSKYVSQQRQSAAAPKPEQPQRDWWEGALPKGDNLGQMIDTKGQPIFEPLGLGGMGPFSNPQNLTALVPRGEPTTPRGSAVDAANLFEARMAGSYEADPNLAALAKRSGEASRKAGQLNMKHSKDKNSASLERIKAQAVSNYLGKQGRTPAMDQYQAAMQALMSRGIGR
jgi:hypothetical protein